MFNSGRLSAELIRGLPGATSIAVEVAEYWPKVVLYSNGGKHRHDEQEAEMMVNDEVLLIMYDGAEPGPESDSEMTWMRTAMAGSKWRSKRAHGRIWERP